MTKGEIRFDFLLKAIVIINRNKWLRKWLIRSLLNNFKDPGFFEIFEKELLEDGSMWTFSFSKNIFLTLPPFLPVGFALNFAEYKSGEGWRYGRVNLYNKKQLEKIPESIWEEIKEKFNCIRTVAE